MTQYIHRAFLFDAQKFRAYVNPLMHSLDENHDIKPLFNAACEVLDNVQESNWVFRVTDGVLRDIRHYNNLNKPYDQPLAVLLENPSNISPYEIGYWMALIFSRFCERTIGVGQDYAILMGALAMVGFPPDLLKQLFLGTKIHQLLKPHSPNISPIDSSSPYWYHMYPGRQADLGWLDWQDHVPHFYNQLVDYQHAIRQFPLEQFGKGLYTGEPRKPSFQLYFHRILGENLYPYYYGRLQATYDRALEMLKTSQEKKLSLYLTITEYSL